MSLSKIFRDYISSIKYSLSVRNWYAALFVSLTIPDICGKYSYPNTNSSAKRYAQWFDKYVSDYYTTRTKIPKGIALTTFLNGNDCYALRCSMLHEGSNEITHQFSRKHINNFVFIAPSENDFSFGTLFCKDVATFRLKVDEFCINICNAIELWLIDIENDPIILSKEHKFLFVHQPSEINCND